MLKNVTFLYFTQSELKSDLRKVRPKGGGKQFLEKQIIGILTTAGQVRS